MHKGVIVATAGALFLTLVAPALAGVISDDKAACYDGFTDASGSVVYFDGELPGCVDGVEPRFGVPNVDGVPVTGPWLYWSQ